MGERYGPLLCQRGEAEKGLNVLQTALAAAEQLGQKALAERLRGLLAQFNPPAG